MTNLGETVRQLIVAGIATGMILASPAGAQTPLSEAVMRGVERHPEVRAAARQVSMAVTDIEIARNAYLPALSGSTGPSGPGVGYDLTLSQTLLDFGATGGMMDQKRSILAQYRANLLIVQDNVALEVVEAHLDIASRRAQLSLVDEHLGHLAELAEMARSRLEGRYSDQAEAGRVALAMATAEGFKARLNGELAGALDQYRLLVGLPAEGLALPAMPQILSSVSDEAALEAAIAGAPLYQRAALAVQVADGTIREARAQRFPRLVLEGSVQRREIGGRMVDDSTVAVRFRFSGHQGLSSLQRPELEAQRREAAVMQAEATGLDIQRMIETLLAQDQSLAGRITALSDQASVSGEVQGVYREQFLVGRRDIQDLVLMQNEHFEAERQIVELTIERLRLQYRAAAQLGWLTALFSGDEMQQPLELLP